MDVVMELARDSPQDQLILTKIRFEQRIIQIKQVLQMQAKMIEELNREIELVKIAKAIERNEIDNLRQSMMPSDREPTTPGLSMSSKLAQSQVMQSAKATKKRLMNLKIDKDGMGMPVRLDGVSSRRDNVH